MTVEAALTHVSRERAAELALDLVRIPSPTGDTRAVTERFAAAMEGIGLGVAWFEAYPATPVVAGRLRGAPGGKTLILNGHLDTVPIPHPAPERRDGWVVGRGASDMKGPLAAAFEAIRAAREAGLRFRGDVLLCAHGLHEAPGGHAEDLTAALAAGFITGDAAVVLELGHDTLPVVQLGSGIFRATFRRDGSATHELQTPSDTPHPILAAAEAAAVLTEFHSRLLKQAIPYAGFESVFIGQLHGGDFYNRFPESAWLEGTRRFRPESDADEVRAELEALLQPVAERHGPRLELAWSTVREGCRIDPEHPLPRAVRRAYRTETGRELPFSGLRTVADAPIFARAGIPCVYHGLAGEGAHADLERISEAELERGARRYLRLVAEYLGLASDP